MTDFVSKYMNTRKMNTDMPTSIPIMSSIMPVNCSPMASISEGVRSLAT